MSIISALGRDKQQDKEFENSLNYIVRFSLKSLKTGLYVSAKILPRKS